MVLPKSFIKTCYVVCLGLQFHVISLRSAAASRLSDLVILYPTLVQLQAAESKGGSLLSGLYGLDFGFGGGRSFSQHAFCP